MINVRDDTEVTKIGNHRENKIKLDVLNPALFKKLPVLGQSEALLRTGLQV